MTDAEARPIITSLRQMLEERGLNWIVRGVDESLRLGKPTVRTIISEATRTVALVNEESTVTEESQDEVSKRRRIQVSTVKKYTNLEELRMLIDAIERTVVAVSEMRPQTCELFERGEQKLSTDHRDPVRTG